MISTLSHYAPAASIELRANKMATASIGAGDTKGVVCQVRFIRNRDGAEMMALSALTLIDSLSAMYQLLIALHDDMEINLKMSAPASADLIDGFSVEQIVKYFGPDGPDTTPEPALVAVPGGRPSTSLVIVDEKLLRQRLGLNETK
jgi:hypothetical protein